MAVIFAQKLYNLCCLSCIYQYVSNMPTQVAGGAGCGRPRTCKACRKLIWRVRGRPLPNLAAELGSVDLVANLQEPAWPTFACTSSSLAYAALT